MKSRQKTRLILAASALTLFLPGCGHIEHKEGFAANANPEGYDYAYMARVERQAEATGTTVIWINPPTIKKAKPHGD